MTTKVNPQTEAKVSTTTGSQVAQKSTAEKAAEYLTEFFQGITDPYKNVYKEVETEGKALVNAFKAATNGNFDGAKKILVNDFNRYIEPYKRAYEHYIKK